MTLRQIKNDKEFLSKIRSLMDFSQSKQLQGLKGSHIIGNSCTLSDFKKSPFKMKKDKLEEPQFKIKA